MRDRGIRLALAGFVLTIVIVVAATALIVSASPTGRPHNDPTPGAGRPPAADPACESTPREIVICLPAGP